MSGAAYWDASAIVPLCVLEKSSADLRKCAAERPMVAWCLSVVEVRSAIERRHREKLLGSAERDRAIANLEELASAWAEVTAVGAVRERAIRLLAVHALRAADAVQLSAALLATGDQPSGCPFFCLDERLRIAAKREGFAVAP